MGPRLTAGLLGAVRQQHPVAGIEARDKSGAGVQPAVWGLSEINDAATAVGRKREEVGEDGLLEAQDRRRLLGAGQSALTAGLGGRIAPDHQQCPALSHQVSLAVLLAVPGSDTYAPPLNSTHTRKPTAGGTVMTQQNPHDTLQADLEALAEVFEAEEHEDRRIEAQRRRDGLPEPKRDIRTFEGFADGGAAPRG